MGNYYSDGYAITDPVPGAPPGSECIGYIGDWNDGRCNAFLNTAACGYDGGDCCLSTCGVGNPFSCSGFGIDCLDPNAEENGGLKLQVNYKEVTNFEVTVSGAQPGSTVVVWTGTEIDPFVLPDNNDYCPSLEVDVEFRKRIPEQYIADNSGQVLVMNNLDTDDPAFCCRNLFQAIEILQDGSCKKSNTAFLQEWRPEPWDSLTCEDHGQEYCNTYDCCQSPLFFCDCEEDCNASSGPDICRAYWLNNEYFLDRYAP